MKKKKTSVTLQDENKQRSSSGKDYKKTEESVTTFHVGPPPPFCPSLGEKGHTFLRVFLALPLSVI